MQGYTITVRMDDGEEPLVTISAREEYRHAEQGEMVAATSTVGGDLSNEQHERLRGVLQEVLDERRAEAEDAGYRGAILAASASIRQAARTGAGAATRE